MGAAAGVPPDAAPLASLRGVTKLYRGGSDVYALDRVDLDLYQSQFAAILGPSGSGKSTLLNILGLIDEPTHGSYHFRGIDVTTLDERRRTAMRGRAMGFVFQSFRLIPHRSALENVQLGLRYRGAEARGAPARAAAALERVGMGHRLGHPPEKLSGGEQQRVSIARALVGEPSVLLCDEPTGNLDSENAAQLIDLLLECRRQGTTVVVITHDGDVARVADRVVTIRDGRITPATHSEIQ